jgi:hypothetical protein
VEAQARVRAINLIFVPDRCFFRTDVAAAHVLLAES